MISERICNVWNSVLRVTFVIHISTFTGSKLSVLSLRCRIGRRIWTFTAASKYIDHKHALTYDAKRLGAALAQHNREAVCSCSCALLLFPFFPFSSGNRDFCFEQRRRDTRRQRRRERMGEWARCVREYARGWGTRRGGRERERKEPERGTDKRWHLTRSPRHAASDPVPVCLRLLLATFDASDIFTLSPYADNRTMLWSAKRKL